MRAVQGPILVVLAELLAKSTPFLLVPYLARLLGVEGFGELANILALAGIVAILVMLSQDVALVRKGYNSSTIDVFKGFLISLIIIISIALILYPASLIMEGGLGSWYLGLSIAWLQLSLCAIQLVHKYVFYFLLQVSVLILNILITFLAGEHDLLNANSRLKIMAGINFLSILILLVFMWVNFSPSNYKGNYRLCLEAIKDKTIFGASLIVSQASNAAKLYLDKILISQLVGMEVLGAYSLSYTFAAASLVVVGAVNKAMLPRFYNEFSKPEWSASKFQIQSIVLGAFALVISAIFYFFPDDIYYYLFGHHIENVTIMVSIFIASIAIYVPCVLITNYLMFKGRNAIISLLSLFSTGVFLFSLIAICIGDMPKYLLPAALLICNTVTFLLLLVYFRNLTRSAS